MTAALMQRVQARPEGVAPLSGELDPAVLAAAQRGDAAALEAFVRHYQRPVFAFLSRMTGRGPHVDDLAQEVFLRAYRALPRFEARPEARLSTWLLGIACNLCRDERRRRTPELVPVEGVPLVAEDGPERQGQRTRIAHALEQAAEQLSVDQRAVFLLSEFHGLDTREIARVTGSTSPTVKTRLFRARAKLRRLLGDVWAEVRS
jgi:RNA polymerase sigma-70 factor (ECF subfamily)